MPWRAWAPLFLMLLSAAPLATAAEGSGGFSLEGAAVFPKGAAASAEPLAVYVSDTRTLSTLEARISEGTIFVVEKRFLSSEAPAFTPRVETGAAVRSWSIRNATIRLLAGNHDGFMGIYTEPHSVLEVTSEGSFAAEPRKASTLGNREATASEDPMLLDYAQVVTEPHIFGSTFGAATYRGIGAVKVQGADVEVKSSNVTRFETGMKETGVAEVTFTWVHVRIDKPSVITFAGVPIELATTATTVRWDGLLRFVPREGGLRTSEGTYSPGPGAATLDGDFTATLTPAEGGRARLELVGELRASSMAYAPAAPVSPGKDRSWWPLLLLGAVVVGAAGGAALAFRPRRERVPFTAGDCAEAGAAACAHEDWAEAADWFERGLKLAPTSVRLHADLAFCLTQLGDIESALPLFRKAHELSQDGEAAFNAATAAAFYDRQDEAADWLMLALARSPEHALHLREDEDLQALLERPEVAEAEHWAREKLRARGHRFPEDGAEP